MAVTTIGEIYTRVGTILQDTSNVRWPKTELEDWINDAYKEIVLHRPDANSETASVTLSQGSRQKLSSTEINLPSALRVIDVIRNVAGTSNSEAIRLIDRMVLDDQVPGWHAVSDSINVKHWMFDRRAPKEFLVYPPAPDPASTPAEVELLYAYVPTGHDGDAENTTIKLDDIYANIIVDYVLYRAYSKDVEYAGDANMAAARYQAFTNALVTSRDGGNKDTINIGKMPDDSEAT